MLETKSPLEESLELLLRELEFKVPVWGVTIFTVDGYVLAHKLFYVGMPPEIEMTISSMSASLISIAEDFIQFVDTEGIFQQVIVDANDNNDNLKFTILLRPIAENVLLTCIFPSSLQLGLVLYEIDTLSHQVQEQLASWEAKVHFETVT